MRSTLIIAAFALAAIAAPIPEAEPIFKGNGEGCVRRIGSKCSIRTRDNSGNVVDADVEASFAKPDTQNKNLARSPYIRSKSVNQRDTVQGGANDLSDYTVQVEQRSPAMSRNKNSRNAEDEQEDVLDGSVQIKQRSPAMSRNKNSRSTEEDEVEDLSSQSTHIEQRSPAMSRNKNSRSAVDEADEDDEIEARASTEIDARSADPITRNGHRSTDLTVAEDEQEHNETRSIRGGGSNKRSAKPEPINRSMHSRDTENTVSASSLDD